MVDKTDKERERPDERGQTYSLEGLTASILIITALVFALNATALTPLTSSTSNKQIQEQNRLMGDDILDTTATNKTLVPLLLNYDTSSDKFKGASDEAYASRPPTEFGYMSQNFLSDKVFSYNLFVQYNTDDGVATERVVYQGEPSENSAASTRLVVLYDNMTITGENKTIGNTTDFYVPDQHPSSPVYNVIQVKIVIWKT